MTDALLGLLGEPAGLGEVSDGKGEVCTRRDVSEKRTAEQEWKRRRTRGVRGEYAADSRVEGTEGRDNTERSSGRVARSAASELSDGKHHESECEPEEDEGQTDRRLQRSEEHHELRTEKLMRSIKRAGGSRGAQGVLTVKMNQQIK